MPERFKKLPGHSTAHEQSLYAPRDTEKTTNPMFKTSYRWMFLVEKVLR